MNKYWVSQGQANNGFWGHEVCQRDGLEETERQLTPSLVFQACHLHVNV